MSSPDTKDVEIAHLRTALAQEKALHARTKKQLDTTVYLQRTQAVTIASQINIIREQIRLHPEDIAAINQRARNAEEDRLRIVEEKANMAKQAGMMM